MRFLILGPLEVHGESGLLALGGSKPRAALGVLLLHPNVPVSAERLALALWGEDAPAGATKTVQVHISRLRKALDDPDVIVTTAAGYCLRVGPGELDAAEFERLVDDGRQALAGGQVERAGSLLGDALKLWRGAPLAGLALDTFHATEVSRLEERRLMALETRIEADLAAGRQAGLIAELGQLVAAHPTRERFVAQLMLALYRTGRQTEALETYREARRALIAEIGVEPGPWLRELQESILRQDAALDPGAVVAELPAELDTTTSGPCVGREDELAWLHRAWERAREGGGGLLIVAGPRGSGKTRLAAELAGDVHRRGDAVLHASCATSAETAVGVMHGLPEAGRPTLVVLDDADGAGPEVMKLLAATALTVATLPVLAVVCCGDADLLGEIHCDGVLTLETLDVEAVRAIAGRYATTKPAEDIPADWLLEASSGLPRRVHEVASQWARREAARRVGAVAGRAANERAQLRTIEAELVGEVAGLQEASVRALPRLPDGPDVICPFKGLASYEGVDAGYFFGRERLVAELVARLVGANVLTVVGPSGSGKSSVLRAGLLPALADGVLPQSEQWSQVLLRPGAHPMRVLTTALEANAGEGRVVVAVDQFEETFTVCVEEDERAEFIAALVTAAVDPGGRYSVVLALRADQYGRCAAYPELSGLLAGNHVLVRSMQRDELRRTIEGPCERSGLRVDPELIDTLVADVEREPGGLPLLSTALLELWQHREGRRLRLAKYKEIGGVRGAVARLAEDAFGRLDAAGQAVARTVLMRLVGAGEGGSVERRRVSLSELELTQHKDLAGVVAMLTDRRLLTVDEETVEMAHEALLREWPRLHDWIEEDLDGLRIRRQLGAAAEEWERVGRDDGALLRGSRLSEATDWRDTGRVALDERERRFLAASEAARAREGLTRRRRARIVISAVTMFLLAGVAVAVAALYAARNAATQASRDIAARSATLLPTNPAVSLALAQVALKHRDTPEAETALRQATLDDRATSVVAASVKSPAFSVVPTSDGRSVITAGDDGTVRIWQLGRRPVGRTLKKFGTPVLSAALSPDGKYVASAAAGGTVAQTPLGGGPTRVVLRLPHSQPYAVAYSSRGIVVGTDGGAVWMIPTRAGSRPYLLGRDASPLTTVSAVAFNPAGTKVVSGNSDSNNDGGGGAYIRDTATRSSIRLAPGAAVLGVNFSRNGRLAATVGFDGAVHLWDAGSGAAVRRLPVSNQPLSSVSFSTDDKRVLTTGQNGVIAITDAQTGRSISRWQTGRPEESAAFLPGTDLVVSTDDGGRLSTWTPLAARAQAMAGILPSFGPDGSRVVDSAGNGVYLWDLATDTQRRLPGTHDPSGSTFSPGGSQIVSVGAGKNENVDVYDLATGGLRQLRFPAFAKNAVAVSRDGEVAVGGSNDVGNWVIYVESVDGTHRVELKGHKEAVNALSFSRDGLRLASASDDGTVRVWNVRTGLVERVIEADPSGVRGVSFSADGTELTTADADGTVGVWPSGGGPPVFLLGHVGPVNTATFNRAGDRIVSTGQDGTVRVWSSTGGDTLVILHQTAGGTSNGAAFSPDGRSVVSAGTDGIVLTPCEVCGSFADVKRVAASRASLTLSASDVQRLVRAGP